MNKFDLGDIKLSRPVVFFDTETTGVDPMTARIIELSCLKLHPDGTIEEYYKKINPGIHIPKEASDVNGITDEDVKDCPKFEVIAENLNAFLADCDLGGYNIRGYDVPLLIEEFNRCHIAFKYSNRLLMDGLYIFRKMFPHNLTTALKYFCNKELEDAHTATADTFASMEVFFAMIPKYKFKSVQDASEFAADGCVDLRGSFRRNEDGKIAFNFGKYRNQSVTEVNMKDPGYMYWLKTKGNLTTDSLRHLSLILSGKEV